MFHKITKIKNNIFIIPSKYGSALSDIIGVLGLILNKKVRVITLGIA